MAEWTVTKVVMGQGLEATRSRRLAMPKRTLRTGLEASDSETSPPSGKRLLTPEPPRTTTALLLGFASPWPTFQHPLKLRQGPKGPGTE